MFKKIILLFTLSCCNIFLLQANNLIVTLKSFYKTSDFAPYSQRTKDPGKFIIHATATGGEHLWVGSNESLLASIQQDRLIVCFKANLPVGFLSYHLRTMPKEAFSSCDTCNVIRNNSNQATIAHIHTLAVLPQERNKGFGSIMIQKAVQEIEQYTNDMQKECTIGIAVHPDNNRALSLYQNKFCFKPTNQISFGIYAVLIRNAIPTTSNIHLYIALIIGLGICTALLVYGILKKRSSIHTKKKE